MDQRKTEISYGITLKKTSWVILLGSLTTTWLFIILDYIGTLKSQGYYSAPVSILELHLLCIPIFGSQLPSYLVSNLICVKLFKRDFIKTKTITYVGSGILGWIIGSLFWFSLTAEYTFDSFFGSLEAGLPTLLIYCLIFLIPLYMNRK